MLIMFCYFELIDCDLFDAPASTYSLAHCVSSDFAMGAGIAKEFRRRFGGHERIKRLHDQGVRVGGVAVLNGIEDSIDRKNIYYLVTKQRYHDKPTYRSMREALQNLRIEIEKRREDKFLAIPKLGCGLDRLAWSKVRQMIQDVFHDCDITISVYMGR